MARSAWREVRTRLIFDYCKWEVQCEDQSVIADYALVLPESCWEDLVAWAEALSRETLTAEAELLQRPELWETLGLPRAIRSALASSENPSPGVARVMRFDFHATDDGWRISEVNSDVPAGFVEASGLNRLAAEYFADTQAPPDPTRACAEAIRELCGEGAMVPLVHATAYSDDRQVMEHLAREFRSLGLLPIPAAPGHIIWKDGSAQVKSRMGCGRASALVRFFPGEWLANLHGSTEWKRYFSGSKTPISNPGYSLLTQSKRFPLVWDWLKSPLPAWRRLLPQTRSPKDVSPPEEEEWVWKPVLGRVGSDVAIAGVTSRSDWKSLLRSARFRPGSWVAQKKFNVIPVETPAGLRFPTVGIFTVDGKGCGAYARASAQPLTDERAQDVALLLEGGTRR